MARGWESKSVEEQQSEFKQAASTSGKPKPQDRQRTQALQALQLQRSRVMEEIQKAENPRFVELKQKELAYLEAELKRLRASGE